MRRSSVGVLILISAVIALAWHRPTTDHMRAAATPLVAAAPERHSATLSRVPFPLVSHPENAESYLPIERYGEHFAPLQPAVVRDSRSHWSNPAKPVLPEFPIHFAAPVRVTCGSAEVLARPLQARAESSGTLRGDGSLVYVNAFDGCDVAYRCAELKTEEFITVKDTHSATTWSWELETHGLRPRLTPAHTIELCDDAGVPRLRINAPEGKDAAGNALRVGERLRLSLDGARVTLAAELSGCAFPVVIDPTWSSTGAMAQVRTFHTATLLPDGTVLVVGGTDSSGNASRSSELYDPGTGAWSSTLGLPNVSRCEHTATLLSNGKVLIAGGVDQTGYAITASELYGPKSGTFSSTSGALGTAHANHTATLLNSGQVLVAGGWDATVTPTISSEVYDPLADSWTPTTGALGLARFSHTATLLNDGTVLVAGGNGSTTSLSTSELYNPATGKWSPTTGALNIGRFSQTANLLDSGKVLIVGGSGLSGTLNTCEVYDTVTGLWTSTSATLATVRSEHTGTSMGGMVFAVAGSGPSGNPLSSTELFDPIAGTWTTTASLRFQRQDHTATRLSNGNLLVAGGLSSSGFLSSTEIFDPHPIATELSASVHTGATIGVSLSANSLSIPSFTIVSSPSHGNISGAFPNVTYTATPPFTGIDTFDYTATDAFGTGSRATVIITVNNTAPIVSTAASPTVLLEGQSTSFSAVASDPDGDALTYLWNFGDGSTSTDPNPPHTYATAGDYSATLTVTDIGNASTVSNVVIIHVFRDTDRPTARFVSSALNGYVGQPVGYDASFSTDPKNNLVSYDWDFGDGSPHGSQQIISRVYAAEGTYTVQLTITDGDGLSDTTTLTMVVLPAAQAGLFNSNIKYSVNWNRAATNADTLNLSATLNVGDATVTSATPLALGIVGQAFTGTSETKLSLLKTPSTGPQVKWHVKRVTKKGAPKGTFALTATVKRASLGQAFALAGVTGTTGATAKIPVRLGIGASNFSSGISSSFRFGGNGLKASGGGSGPN